MDSAAYLRRHGWQGAGFSLNPEKSQALKKPLLVSRKIDVLGVGLNKNDSVSDQWWLRAFDSSLKALGTGQKGALDSVREHGVKRGGLYGRFVKGQDIPGTIGQAVEQQHTSAQKDAVAVEVAVASSAILHQARKEDTDSSTMVTKRKHADAARGRSAKRQRFDNDPNNPNMQPLGQLRDSQADPVISQANGVAVSQSAPTPQVNGKKKEHVELLPGEKGYKAQKYERERIKRQMNREARHAEAMSLIDPNETPIQRQERIRRERGIVKAAKKEKTLKKEAKQKAKQDRVLATRAAKKARKELVREKKRRIDEILAEEDRVLQEKRAAELAALGITEEAGDAAEGIEGNADFVSLTEQKKKKYATPAEKREKKVRALAIERGVTVEEMKAELERGKEIAKELEQEYTVKGRAEKLGIDLETYQKLPESSWDVRKRIAREARDMDDEKKARYEERAQAKGQHFLHYFIARTLKNEAAKAKALEESGLPAPDEFGFVIDRSGDANAAGLLDFHHNLIKKKNFDLTLPAEEIWEKIDPNIWKDKVVKSLSKDERELRRIWLRTRRRLRTQRDAAAGLPPKRSRIGADGKTKDQRKVEIQENLTHSILNYSRRVKFGGPPKDDGQTVIINPVVEDDEETKAARKRAAEAGAEFIPLDPTLLEDRNPNLYVPKGPIEAPPIGPNNEPYPIMNVESATGKFNLLEIKLARRQARRMLRHEKQQKKRGVSGQTKAQSRRDRFRKKRGGE